MAKGRSWSRKIFLLFTSSRPVTGPTQSPIKWVQELFARRLQRPRRETDPSSPKIVGMKSSWICTYIPPYVFKDKSLNNLVQGQLFLPCNWLCGILSSGYDSLECGKHFERFQRNRLPPCWKYIITLQNDIYNDIHFFRNIICSYLQKIKSDH
jgi:hypothetical protein